jgi:hypothetical protein
MAMPGGCCDPQTTTIEIELHCGDGMIGKCEACDIEDKGGKTCKSFGYEGGALDRPGEQWDPTILDTAAHESRLASLH